MAHGLNQIALTLFLFPHLIHAQEPIDIEQFASDVIAAEKAAWEQGEFEALFALEQPDVVFQNINGAVFRGWDERRQAIEDTKASFNGAPITQKWQYWTGDGNVFAVSYVCTIHIPNAPLEITGIAVGRLENGKRAEELGAAYTIEPEGAE